MHLDYATRGSWILAALLIMGCTDDSNPSGEGGGGSSSSSSGTTAGSTDDGQTGTAPMDSSAGDQGGSSSGGGTTMGLPTEVRMGGTIEDFFLMGPIPNAQISLLGVPSVQTVSDNTGAWELLAVPADTFDRFLIADSESYWGGVLPFQTQFEDIEDFELTQVSLQVIDIQIEALQMQDPTVLVEDDTAVLLVALLQNTATGAVVELDPPPAANTFYAPNADGQPILGVNEIQWSIYPVAVFFNLAPGPEGTYEINVTHPERECTVDDPQPPTFGRFVNLIRVDCPPPA
jgi:hypothetical protein